MQFWQSNSLHLLAERIREEHSAAEVAKGAAVVAARKGIEHALVAGDLLIEAKAQIPHGHWLPWLAENCPTVSERMAQHYMRLARNRVELEAEKRNVSDLSLREAVRLLDEDDDEDADEDADEDTDWDDEPDPLSDQQKDQILALRQNYGWEPDAIAKTLKLPLDDVRRFLQPTDDDDDDDDEPRRKRRRKRQQLGGSGDNEYLTPPKYIEAARDVLGTIDLDPASCHEGQVNVRAAQYFTKEDDGLQQQWHGRVFLNPTWSDMLPWVAKLMREYQSGRVKEAIMLTTSNTSARWFRMAAHACTAICFTDHNIAFIHKTKGQMTSASTGQTFFYFGPDIDKFVRAFGSIGYVVPPPLKPRTAISSLEVTRLHLVSVTTLKEWLRAA
jgi:DNA N-6-adenine-methyltransferase (Dam)/Protein of unknown function (DUF3102)